MATPKKMTVSHHSLRVKKAQLSKIRNELKLEFFGIDDVIDRVIDSIKTWYILPEIVTRPIIVNLFGMTGIGKTALVRSLIHKLGFASKFVEIQMDGFSNSGIGAPTSICQILEGSNINEGETGIILLDEFQRYRTVDDKGTDVKVERYQDVWMLLSDGKFSNDYSFISKLEQELADSEYMLDSDKYDEEHRKAARAKAKKAAERKMALVTADDDDDEEDDEVTVSYIRKYRLWPHEARKFKKLLKVPDSLQEIMTWETEKIHAIMRQYLDDNKDGLIDYTKCLIFVAGNMDEAFKMADSVEDCDTSADVYHEFTKQIGIFEVKKALTERFKPEQIARLGNNFIVYPSLNAKAYLSIIRRACRSYTDEAFSVCGIKFKTGEAVYQEIYDNAVYPTQGTRPVFTSIHKMFGSPLSDAILWALEHDFTEVDVSLDLARSSLLFKAGGKEVRSHIEFDVRERRSSRSNDLISMVAVHEAGHALLYCLLFRHVPREVAVSVASFKGGYNIFKDTTHSKDEVLNRLVVGMGGIAAEQLVFGEGNRSTGCAPDVTRATNAAGMFVRQYAMSAINSSVSDPGHDSYQSSDFEGTNPMIEAMMRQARIDATKHLTEHRDLFLELSRHLVEVKHMTAAAMKEWLGDRIPGMKDYEERDVNVDYEALLAKA